MRWFKDKDEAMELALRLRQQIWELEKRITDQDETIEDLRIRLSGPAQDAKPVPYKASDWLAQRKELESKFATQGENHAKQSAVA